MALIASVFPILPGKTEDWRQFSQEMLGPRREEYEASRQRLGVRREMAVLQQTPQGDVAILVGEGDQEPAQLLGAIAMSNDPFDVWFRQKLLELHGLDLSQPPAGPPPEVVHNWSAS